MNNSNNLFQDSNSKQKKVTDTDTFKESCQPLETLLDSVRNVEGFPIAKDEDILALSDPPYYTACPNPYLKEYIKQFGAPYQETDDYSVAPFVGDVSEGKNDPIYNAHAYHTKVPHKAIMHYILHYTKPGDIVFDGFCGTGMTGVAAQFCGDKDTITELGYQVDANENIKSKEGQVVTKLGPRRAILNDLSPAATFISQNLIKFGDPESFGVEANTILEEVEKECGWMYETLHSDGKTIGKINYTVWSDVFICPYCLKEYVFWDVAVDQETGEVKKIFFCSSCNAELGKQECEHGKIQYFDEAIQQEIIQSKSVPVMINYSIGKKRYEKKPTLFDIQLIETISKSTIPHWYPINEMMNIGIHWGDTWRSGVHFGITNVHQFFSKRNLWTLSCFWEKGKKLKILFTSIISRSHKLNRYMPNHFRHVGPLSGTLYIPTLECEINILETYKEKIQKFINLKMINNKNSLISTNSTTQIQLQNNSIDYIFTDPPFGDNLMYSELNFIWESWLKVITNNHSEAIINNSQQKGLEEYKQLMTACFKEMYRILKPNRWMTVEFHNSKASVWNAIQEGITKAGFIIAQVAIIDKEKGTTKQLSYAGAVKNDLVINAYKPKQAFEENFLKQAGANLEREFVEQHLAHLPIEHNIERTEQMLYSKMLAHYVQYGFEIRYNAHRFYQLMRDNFKLIDGYWFNDDQVLAFDEWKKSIGLDMVKGINKGKQTLFIFDEKSALIWLYHFLETFKTYSDIFIAYQQAVSSLIDKIPELRTLLEHNFIFENDAFRRPYSEKEQDRITEIRERDLEKDFNQLVREAKTSNKKIKELRKEAVLFGFTKAYQEKRYTDILEVANKLNPSLLEENSDIAEFVEIAKIKTGRE